MPYIGNPIYQSAFVTDQFSGTGSQTAYTMSVAPAGTTNVLVVVSGVVQDPSTYGVVGNTLTFSAAPPSGTGNISCRYLGVPVTGVTTTAYRTVTEFTATAGQTTFTPPSYSVGFINVYLNGVLLGSADYTATNGTTVVLATGASAGNLVTVESFQISSVANAIQNTAGSVSSSNIATGAVTPAKLSTGGPSWNTTGSLTVTNSAGSTGLLVTGSGTGTQYIEASNTGGSLLLGLDNSTGGLTGNAYGAFIGTYSNKVIALITNGTIRATINTSGALALQGGNISANGVGITFPVSQSASTDPNTLDDYEEGTWTPAFTNFSGTSGWTFTNAAYIKIGKTVFINCQITPGAGTISCSSNSGLITGIPFPATGANSPIPWATNYIETLGTGVIYGSSGVYAPTISVANSRTIFFAGSYITTA